MPTSHFGRTDQFRASIGIDPWQAIDDSFTNLSSKPSGLLKPVAVTNLGTTLGAPVWFVNEPKTGLVFVYDAVGSVYTVDSSLITQLGDLNDGGTAMGNGAEYYDNYVYFARSTTIARYGPLNGTASFTDDYWVGTLGKSALSDTTYPVHDASSVKLPNHVLHRHSDGALYIADVVDNRGTVHFIKTTKTTVEGDTDNGSTYAKVQVGYGLWPTAIESYGSNLAIAFIEGQNDSGSPSNFNSRAKLAFWDTSSQNVNQITWVEFPDQFITALKNVNGNLYIFSGNGFGNNSGFRLSRYVGGYSFETILSFQGGDGESPLAGAVDGTSDRLSVGSYVRIPEDGASVLSVQLDKLSNGFFNTMRATANASVSNSITALKYALIDQDYTSPLIGWVKGSTYGIDTQVFEASSYAYNNAPSVWWSDLFRIGQPFKIKKIRIPLAQAIAANMTVTPKIYTDDGAGTTYTGGTSNGLAIINNTNYNGKRNIVMRPENMTGDHNFWIELRWTGSALCTVGLPITIEYELIDD